MSTCEDGGIGFLIVRILESSIAGKLDRAAGFLNCYDIGGCFEGLYVVLQIATLPSEAAAVPLPDSGLVSTEAWRVGER